MALATQHGSPEAHRMRATRFEMRHYTLVHLLVVGAAWSIYLFDRDDILWRMIRVYPSRRLLEHVLFGVATVLIGIGALLSTRARAAIRSPHSNSRPALPTLGGTRLIGEWLYAFGFATLLPLWGSILLIAGESIRIARLALALNQLPSPDGEADRRQERRWARALRTESVKWGIFATMILFSVCLVDRVADDGILLSVLAGAVLNMPVRRTSPTAACG